jgi:hypothetical protein
MARSDWRGREREHRERPVVRSSLRAAAWRRKLHGRLGRRVLENRTSDYSTGHFMSPLALAFAAGGLVHVLVEFLLEQIPLCHESEDRRRMWMICTAVAMDLIKQ